MTQNGIHLPSFEEQQYFSFGIVNYKTNTVFVEPSFADSLTAAKQTADDFIKQKLQEDYFIIINQFKNIGFPTDQELLSGEKHISSILVDENRSLVIEVSEMSLDIFLRTKSGFSFVSDSFKQIYKFFITEHVAVESPRKVFLIDLQNRLKEISSKIPVAKRT
jgi:hypothetical protein